LLRDRLQLLAPGATATRDGNGGGEQQNASHAELDELRPCGLV
jgi:hypothetical protein